MENIDNNNILEVKNLKKYFVKNKGLFGQRKQYVQAVDDISFYIKKGETFGLVGESGCGKTTVGRSLIKLYESTGGEVYYKGERISVGKLDIFKMKKEKWNKCKEYKIKKVKIKKKFVLDIQKIKGINQDKIEIKKKIKLAKQDYKVEVKLLKEDKTKKLNIIREKIKEAKQDNKVKPQLRKSMQMIFQDPYASLNSRMTVADIISEPMKIHQLMPYHMQKQKIYELLNMVGLSKEHASRYPHEFSGGQRQRIGIARSLAVNPEFIICDEPISALDVSIQAQIINLLEELQEKLGLTYMFVAHDLSMVKHISNRIAVMYLGKIVEVTTSNELFKNPLHPYTKALLSAVPIPNVNNDLKSEKIELEGDIPSPINPPSGCRFRTRCEFASERCKKEEPVLQQIDDGHIVACHLVD
ncbi:ATP-binding cassette domain-containing protein [Mycoplasmatota bacterium]|nr:ATP-binding cassette domain-containing protein [Mycoplasmatota bacterium]